MLKKVYNYTLIFLNLNNQKVNIMPNVEITVATLVALAMSEPMALAIAHGLEQGKSRDDLISDAYNADKASGINSAMVAVQKALVAAGLERTPKQKRAAWDAAIKAIPNFDLTDPDHVEAAIEMAEAEAIPLATAKRYLKEKADVAGVVVANAGSARDTKRAALEAWYKHEYRAGNPTDRKSILAKCSEVGMTEASAQYYINMFSIVGRLLADLCPVTATSYAAPTSENDNSDV